MKKFVKFLCQFIDIYIYYVVICCFLTWIPNLNWDFPAIKVLFWIAGFNILSNIPILSMFVPLIMICLLIALRRFLYRLIGEEDKFFGMNTDYKKENDNKETNSEDITNDNKDNSGADTDS